MVVLAEPQPTAAKGTASGRAPYEHAALPPAGFVMPYASSPFTVPACATDPCITPPDFMDPNSAAMVRSMMAAQPGGFLDLGDIAQGASADNDFPIYYASATDPVYTITCYRDNGCGAGAPMSVRIPDGARASSGSDHHLTVVDAATGTEVDFGQFNDHGTGVGTTDPVSGGGILTTGYAGICTSGSFASNVNTCHNGAIAAGFAVQPVMLDPREILSGTIRHALYVAIGCGSTGYVFPAVSSDGLCRSSGPKYGERIWLDLSDAQIDALRALGDPPWAITMLHAMHRYGWMVADNNGGGPGIGFALLGAASFTVWGQPDPWPAFWAAAAPGHHHVTIPTIGISPSNVHVLSECVNTNTC